MVRLVVLLFLLPCALSAAPWRLDPETRIAADVTWQGAHVEIRFPGLTGTIDFDADHPETASATISVPAGGATTGLAPVDLLLRGPGYLAAEEFPTITYRLDRLEQTSPQTADVTGRITLRGVTRPLALSARVFRYGPADDDPARFEAGFDLAGEIDRSDFGSVAGLPDVGAVMPLRIRLLMRSH